MSVFVADVVLEAGSDAKSLIADHPGYAVAAITAGLALDLGQIVVMVTEEGVGHAHVVGPKSRKTRQKLAKAATWVLPPAGPPGPRE